MKSSNLEKTDAEIKLQSTESDCYLHYLNMQQCLIMSTEILAVLDGENNLNADQTEYWVARLKHLIEMAGLHKEMVEARLQNYELEIQMKNRERQQAVNTLVPFVNKAHLN